MRRKLEWKERHATVHLDGRMYAVDFDTREFREMIDAAGRRDVVGFETVNGQRMWDELMILKCVRCRVVAVEQRYVTRVRCRECGRWLVL